MSGNSLDYREKAWCFLLIVNAVAGCVFGLSLFHASGVAGLLSLACALGLDITMFAWCQEHPR